MNLDILIVVLIFLVSLVLIYWDKKLSFYVLMVLSLFLHKELFSFYRWNLLPIRIFMFSFLVWGVYESLSWFLQSRDLKKLWGYLKKPFISLLITLWVVRGISLLFTENLFSSVTLFGFFTTMVALGIFLYIRYKNSPDEVFKFIKFYIYALFVLCLFAYFQGFLYLRTGFIIGALWNVPGKFPRLGSIFWDVNHFAGLLAAILPVLGALILVAKGIKKKVLYIFMFISMTGVLMLTNSRTSWVLAFVALVSFFGILLFRRFGMRGIFAILFVLTLVSSLGLVEYMDKSSPFRRKIKDYFHYRMDSFASHMMLVEGSYQIFEEYPYLGGGYGGFFEHFAKTEVASRYFRRDPAAFNTRVPAHTIWGEVIAETGFLGLVPFVLFVFLVLGTLLYLALNAAKKRNIFLASAMFSSLLGWLAAGIFYSYNSEFFFIVLFLFFLYGIGVLQEDYNLNKILSFYDNLGKVPLILISVLSLILIFAGLGVNHLIPWDEAIYAGVAKNMVETGEYLVQRWHDSYPWYEKPPLYMWLMAGLMKVFGYSSWAARIPSAIFGLGTVISVYLFVKKYFNKAAAFVSSLALVTTVHFLYYARASMLDVTTTFFISLSLFLYYKFREASLFGKTFSGVKRFRWILSGLFLGLAVMTKGVVGFLPIPIIFLYDLYLLSISQQKFNKNLIFNYLGMIFGAMVVFLPWHVAMYARYGSSFIDNYIGYHVLDRALTSIEDKGRPFFWYFTVMKVSMRIWFVVLTPAFFYGIYRAFKKDNRLVFLFIWVFFVFLFFSSARSKLIWYIIPIYPAAAIIIGYFVKDVFNLMLEKIVPSINTNLARFIGYFLIASFALFYFFLNRDLVYRSDLTGSQAQLLELKDEQFGKDTKLYADRIELPLVLYYSDSPFEVVDFTPLKYILAGAGPDDEIIFITKESRFRAFKEIHSNLRMRKQINEWVLGYLPSAATLREEMNMVDGVVEPVEKN